MMQLGTLERSIMQALWEHPEGVFANHLAAMLPTQPATTTVLTVLVRLSHKGMVARERIGRAHLYKATATKDAFVAEAMHAALNEAGDLEAAVQRFVGTVTPQVAAALLEALGERDGSTT